MILRGRRAERRAARLPVWDQFVEGARLDDRAGQYMRADFRAFLEDANREPGIELAKPDRRRKAGRTRSDHNDVKGHQFTAHRSLAFC